MATSARWDRAAERARRDAELHDAYVRAVNDAVEHGRDDLVAELVLAYEEERRPLRLVRVA